jgi:hypothetical protein
VTKGQNLWGEAVRVDRIDGFCWVACLTGDRLCDCHPGKPFDVKFAIRMDGWMCFESACRFIVTIQASCSGKLKSELLTC